MLSFKAIFGAFYQTKLAAGTTLPILLPCRNSRTQSYIISPHKGQTSSFNKSLQSVQNNLCLQCKKITFIGS